MNPSQHSKLARVTDTFRFVKQVLVGRHNSLQEESYINKNCLINMHTNKYEHKSVMGLSNIAGLLQLPDVTSCSACS